MPDVSYVLTSIDERLHAHAHALHLDPAHIERARSLAMAGAIAALFRLSAGELFALLSPAFEEWQRRNRTTVESNEVQ